MELRPRPRRGPRAALRGAADPQRPPRRLRRREPRNLRARRRRRPRVRPRPDPSEAPRRHRRVDFAHRARLGKMPSLTNLLVVSVVAFAAPFVLGLFPSVRLPSVLVEIVAGIVIGPSVLGIVKVDQAISVVALIGLTFVLFLAGLEIDFTRLRGPVLRLTALAFAVSF